MGRLIQTSASRIECPPQRLSKQFRSYKLARITQQVCSTQSKHTTDHRSPVSVRRSAKAEVPVSSWSPWEDASYCWVVICKNKRFHRHAGTDIGYKIPLAETDAVSRKPDISAPFPVRCPDCSAEYSYKPGDLQRVELNLVDSFTTHPLFRASEEAEPIPPGASSSLPRSAPVRVHPPTRWWPWKRRS